ncbi:MAG TPA: adenylate/guanylate cyclase domain-containing protein [Xanthobacteraceae bacterium]|nr:adenylate/guanylate cyclase domain-containing protein [Xanthobacteraceae bacterium]
MSTTASEERLDRALTAFLRQEVQAPATAVTEFLDMIIEDARRLQLELMLPDLNRMRSASAQLNTFVKTIIQNSAADRNAGEAPEEFRRRLRHDLRTPLNAIKGYSELLIEDMEGDGEQPLRSDLMKLKDSADQLLRQIDAMVALTGQNGGEEDGNGERTRQQLEVVADVLRMAAPLRASDAVREGLQSNKILVVDDNAANRDVLERRLTREGRTVVTAASGATALDLLITREFDLILLDLIMPEMSGFEVLRRLKASEQTRDIPVIVISALDELDSVVRCIEAGAEDYLTKPFNPTLLRARVDASLEKKWLRDREKKFIADLEQEKRRSESLLLNILPQSIVNRMREGETTIADRVREATILFCDLVGFTTISRDLSADYVIDFLGKIFSAFDRLAAEYGVEKIKTIGDAYMAAAGIPEPQADHAARVARFALRMLDAVDDIGGATDLKLQARIGIHTGPIVSGVIGTHKFAYDVWGDTVNTASRMESHSLPGRIQVSAATRILLGNCFDFEERGTIDVKGKGAMETFFLNGQLPTVGQ